MSKTVVVGNLKIGGGNPVSVQSMTNTDTSDVESTVAQIERLQAVGCELVRVSANTESAALAVRQIKSRISLPLCVDIHFDYRLALLCEGADKIRINPSNIGSEQNVRKVVDFCKERKTAIRVGGNLGSIKDFCGETPANALVKCVLSEVAALEKFGFDSIVVSAKTSSVRTVVEVYERLSKEIDYPLHIGLTEAGTYANSLISSSAACGALLLKGIGDTLRYSISDEPEKEVVAARKLLNFLELRHDMPVVVSCPTCARTNIDVVSIAKRVEERAASFGIPVKIAVMGCVVNGIGESRGADFGVAGGKDKSAIICGRQVVKTVANDQIENELMLLLNEFAARNK